MASPGQAPSRSASVADRSGPTKELERLDVALGRIRRLWERGEVASWFRGQLGAELVDITVYRTLRAIDQAGTDPSVNDVAEALRVDGSTASRFVDRAVGAGLVTRSIARDDRRRSSLDLSDAGRTRLAELRRLRLTFLTQLTTGWPDDDVTTLASLLERLDGAVAGLGRADDDEPQ